MKTIQREIVSALLLTEDGTIFFGRKDRNSGDTYAGCWHIPGGGIDEAETKEAGLIREVMEETGIDISNCFIELIDDIGRGVSEKLFPGATEKVLCDMHFNVYKVILGKNANEIDVHLSNELAEYKWVKINEIESIQKTPPGIEFFNRLDKKVLAQ